MNLDLRSSDGLFTMQHRLDDLFFECELIIRNLFGSKAPPSTAFSSDADHRGVKLPKLSAPTLMESSPVGPRFGSNSMSPFTPGPPYQMWRSLLNFATLSKKVLPSALLSEGLSLSGDYYSEAIETLRAHYDRPRLIHQSHMSVQFWRPLG